MTSVPRELLTANPSSVRRLRTNYAQSPIEFVLDDLSDGGGAFFTSIYVYRRIMRRPPIVRCSRSRASSKDFRAKRSKTLNRHQTRIFHQYIERWAAVEIAVTPSKSKK